MSATVTEAWITFAAVILAALIGGVFLLFGNGAGRSSKAAKTAGDRSPAYVAGDNSTINVFGNSDHSEKSPSSEYENSQFANAVGTRARGKTLGNSSTEIEDGANQKRPVTASRHSASNVGASVQNDANDFPDILYAKESIDLRGQLGTRELLPIEDDQWFDDMPNGSFAYTHPAALRRGDEKSGIALRVKQRIRKDRRGTGDVEIHKTNNGKLYVFGYVPQETLRRLKVSEHSNPIETVIYLLPSQTEDEFAVAIPVSRLTKWVDRRPSGTASIADVLVR